MTEKHYSRTEQAEAGNDISREVWRKELHARLDRYRSRRGRRIEGAFSMRFPFPPPETAGAAPETEPPAMAMTSISPAEAEKKLVAVLESEPQPAPVLDPAMTSPAPASPEPTRTPEPTPAAEPVAPATVDPSWHEAPFAPLETANEPPAPEPPVPEPPVPRPKPRRKVIAFPRSLSLMPEPSQRLADPVGNDQPRILDVPEELEAVPTTPFLEGLQLDAPNQTTAYNKPAEHVSLLFRPATIEQRIRAATIDLGVVVMGAVLCGSVVFEMLHSVQVNKPLLVTTGLLFALLWISYHYLFLVYGGATAGTRMAAIELSSFAGTLPSRKQRRNRVIGLCISSVSLLMGFLWAFVDVDTLCWHDRISQTYLRSRD